jgi:hypothetical protein
MTLPPNVLAFQKDFVEKHPEFINSAHELSGTCNEILADAPGLPIGEPQVVSRHLTQSVANSFLAMNLLAWHGHGCDALKIVRSMFEAAVVLASFDHYPALIQDFIDFQWIMKMKLMGQAKGTARESLISAHLRQEIQQHYDSVLPRFCDKNGKPLSSWYKGSFLGLCKRLDDVSSKNKWGAESQYHDLYRFSSELMHGDIIGLMSQVDSTGYNAEIPPSQNYVGESLMSGHWALVMALISYANIVKLAKAEIYGSKMIDGWMKVWGEGSQEFQKAKKESDAAFQEAL